MEGTRTPNTLIYKPVHYQLCHTCWRSIMCYFCVLIMKLVAHAPQPDQPNPQYGCHNSMDQCGAWAPEPDLTPIWLPQQHGSVWCMRPSQPNLTQIWMPPQYGCNMDGHSVCTPLDVTYVGAIIRWTKCTLVRVLGSKRTLVKPWVVRVNNQVPYVYLFFMYTWLICLLWRKVWNFCWFSNNRHQVKKNYTL
jgi:hypothetical protein